MGRLPIHNTVASGSWNHHKDRTVEHHILHMVSMLAHGTRYAMVIAITIMFTDVTTVTKRVIVVNILIINMMINMIMDMVMVISITIIIKIPKTCAHVNVLYNVMLAGNHLVVVIQPNVSDTLVNGPNQLRFVYQITSNTINTLRDGRVKVMNSSYQLMQEQTSKNQFNPYQLHNLVQLKSRLPHKMMMMMMMMMMKKKMEAHAALPKKMTKTPAGDTDNVQNSTILHNHVYHMYPSSMKEKKRNQAARSTGIVMALMKVLHARLSVVLALYQPRTPS